MRDVLPGTDGLRRSAVSWSFAGNDSNAAVPAVRGRPLTHGVGHFPVIQAARRLRHQRRVSRDCRHRRSPARGAPDPLRS